MSDDCPQLRNPVGKLDACLDPRFGVSANHEACLIELLTELTQEGHFNRTIGGKTAN